MRFRRSRGNYSHRRYRLRAGLASAAAAALVLTGCGGSEAEGRDEIVVAIVSNPQMQDAITLQDEFKAQYPDIDVSFVSLPENEARAKITASVATQGGEFDVVMISNYETPMWAENGWITNLQEYADSTEGYDPDDFVPTIREALSYEGDLYSVPFYGESSFLVYRQDLFDDAGLTMPETPTWEDIRGFAEALNDPENNMSGVCLRGLAGWGEVMAPLDTMINTYGGRWFDEDWNARLDEPVVEEAVTDYVDLVQNYGQAGAATSGYGDCLTLYSQGNTAMWYDATAMVSAIEDPASSLVVGKSGYAPAPVKETESAGWLYSWSLAIPTTSNSKDAAWDFVSWMTDKEYIRLVGEEIGWERVPPGSRLSTYEIPEYAEVAEAYAEPTLDAMAGASQENSMVRGVPYTGLQFVGIPEFQDLGTRVAQQISAAIAGQQTVQEALEQSQGYAETVAESYQDGAG
ncbi:MULTISPECIES: sugar ABC transporter substrate-binding protein [Arthrobacter]|uniref:Sugar ABC transporter substrate-binding protein n=1 Tax=Arthrobacter jinronghuae TaxID=2964609 RepID=A0ABT1NLN8_9MICC|nr:MULTISPECIES: sugar ABC transporter substrate-binding protein [Arthrobacter]MCQ1948643.1 sugar ABC transporter substrate-binding protein [Arthrobacter jinronghuae]MCQ1951969.1 sugar ABC transporter substrate-binding protein [Arthrobacter sp. zg-Y238]MCQ1955895.1 sugar ABC transporter substrate-binding protein [Arthrobacter jinronghuae]UWX78542.1 sugar ABC transporter substrate-binding protein [Arthrobacter jinronghuae]